MIKSETKWIVNNNFNDDINLDEIFDKDYLKLNCNLSDAIKKILVTRNIDTKEKAYKFFCGTVSDLYSPLSILDMDKAVTRIMNAIINNEKIMIYGDYDTDGTTSSTILFSYLKSLKDDLDIDYYIPNRLSEGYGINADAINEFKNKNIDLIITVDTGISAISEAKLIKELGMDLIVTDHHEMQDEIPSCIAVCDVKRTDEKYPFSEIAGCGMAYKLVCAIDYFIKNYFNEDEKLNSKYVFNVENYPSLDNDFVDNYIDKNIDVNDYLELVCLGTIADIVPLVDENRIFVKEGLKRLKNTTRPGLISLIYDTLSIDLLDSKNKDIELSSTDIAFNVVPKLNVAGRIDDAKICCDLFMAKDEKEAKELTKDLIKKNDKRKRCETKIFDEATYILDNYEDFRDEKFIIVKNKDWHQGVIGIVAARLCERYHKPCLVLSEDEDGNLTGSARRYGNVNVFDILSSGKIYLKKFGGHEGACGLSLDSRDFDNFRNTVMTYASNNINDDLLIPSSDIDIEIDAKDIDISLCNELKLLEPYGEANKEILIKTNVSVINQSLMGKENNHLRLKVKDPNNNSNYNVNSFDVVGFYKQDLFSDIVTGDEYEVIGNVTINEFMGNKKVQFMLSDMRNKLSYILASSYYRSLYSKVKNAKDIKDLYCEDVLELSKNYSNVKVFSDLISAEAYVSKINNDYTGYVKDSIKTIIVINNKNDFIQVASDYYNYSQIFYNDVTENEIDNALKSGEKRLIILCNNLQKIIDLRKNYTIIYIDSLYSSKDEINVSKSDVSLLYKRLCYYEKINKNEVYLYDMAFNLKELNTYKIMISLDILNELEIIKYETLGSKDNKDDDNELIKFIINKDVKNPIDNSKLYKLLNE